MAAQLVPKTTRGIQNVNIFNYNEGCVYRTSKSTPGKLNFASPQFLIFNCEGYLLMLMIVRN